MSDQPVQPNNNRKLWIAIGVIAALAIIGVIIWRMIAVPD